MITLRLIVIFLAVLLCLNAVSEVQAEPRLKPVEETYDFGCIGIDYTVYHVFKLTNDGDTDLKIDSLYATCDCSTVSFYKDSVLHPGDTVSFELKFNTKDYYGPTSRNVRVVSNDPVEPAILIKYTSIVGQWPYRIRPEPMSLFFLPGHKMLEATLENPLLESLEFIDFDPFDDVVEVNLSSKKVGKGGKIVLEIIPREDLTPGTHNSNFRVRFKAPDGKPPLVVTFPVKVVKY